VNDPLILVRVVHFAATLTLAGALIFATAIAGPVLRRADDKAACVIRLRLLCIVWLGFGLALLSALVWLTLVAAQTGEAGSRASKVMASESQVIVARMGTR